MENIIWTRVGKEEHQLKINGVDMGIWDRSKMRHFIQQTDNAIEDYLPKI